MNDSLKQKVEIPSNALYKTPQPEHGEGDDTI